MDADVPARTLAAPPGNLFNVAWLTDGWIYVGRSVDAGGLAQTWRVRPTGRTAEQFRLPALAGCRLTEYFRAEAFPSGALGLTRYCAKDPPLRTDTGVLDPRSLRFRVLAPLGDFNPSAVTWAPGARWGFVSHTDGICAGIAPLGREGRRSLPGPVTLDGRTWQLDEDAVGPATDCADRGRADLPVLSPDARTLYFVGSPESKGVHGEIAREETGWGLYRVPVDDGRFAGEPRRITDELGKPQGLAVSRDGASLVYAGQRKGRYGLWLVDTRTGRARRLAQGKFMYGAFAPDGRQVAAVFQRDADHCRLLAFDLTAA